MPLRSIVRALVVATLILPAASLRAQEPTVPAPDPAGVELQRFIRSLVLTNPDVQAARAALEASGAMRDAASRPLYNPELSADVQRSADDPKTIGISQTLDWAGKRSARSDAAERERLVAEARYTLAVWSVSTDLLGGLARYHTAAVRRDLTARTERVVSEFESLAERRFQAGDLNQVDLSLARLSATDARIQRATRTGDLAAAQQAVRALAVDSPSTAWPVLATPPSIDSALGDGSIALVRSLPEVVASQRRVELADALVTVRRKDQRPDPTLSLVGGEEADESLIGLSISIPLFVRNRFDNEVRAALAERNEAQFSSDATVQRAQARLMSAYERYTLLHAAWDEWERGGQPSLELQTDQLGRLWQAGELSTTDYLVQMRQTFEVQDNALQLRLALWEGWFEWLRASGQIDDWLSLSAPAAE